MRLGSHIALELVVGAMVLGGVAGGALLLVPSLVPGLSGPPAHAATSPARPVAPVAAEPGAVSAPAPAPAHLAAAPAPLPAAAPAVNPSAAAPGDAARSPEVAAVVATTAVGSGAVGADPAQPRDAALTKPAALGAVPTVYGASDAELLAPLRDQAVSGVKLNFGGTTLSLRLDFVSGGRAAFKPEQIHPGSQPRREIAAFVVDRLLGIGRVPPAAAIAVRMDQLLTASPPSTRGEINARLQAEARPRRGVLRGVASWWIPEIKVAAIGKHPIDSTDGIVTWKRHLAIGGDPPEDVRPLVAAISDMVLFDFLIDNSDRWSGGNARTSPDGKILYFMDNTMSFSTRRQGHTRTATYLRRVHKFSRRLVAEVRALTRERLVTALAAVEDGGMGTLLSDAELDAVMARREVALQYLDELLAQHGEDQVLVFP